MILLRLCAIAIAELGSVQAAEPDPTSESQATGSARGVVLAPVDFGAARDERVAKAFEDTLREQLGAAVEPCTEEPCSADGGTLVRIAVDERERDYAMTITTVDARGSAGATRRVDCTVCTPKEAAAVTASAITDLLATPDASAHVSVVSTPSGAEVWLDGVRVGTTPAELTTTAGLHTLELRMSGRRARAQELELEAGAHESVRIELPPARTAEQQRMRIAGWTLVGVGVAALIGGITLVAIDENPIKSDCSGVHKDAFGNCEFRWNTMAGGATLLVGGLAAAGAGTALVVLGSSKRRAELRGGPTHASITVRF